MRISVCIMAHPKRRTETGRLFAQLMDQGFPWVQIQWDQSNNEWENGLECIKKQLYTDSEWHIIIQDDAVISKDFFKNVNNALDNAPAPSLLSFYTGTHRPKRALVKKAVDKAIGLDASWLKARTLFWGVCIAIPSGIIKEMITSKMLETSKQPYDRRIGDYFMQRGKPVYYTNPSLVDHLDGESLLPNHKPEAPRVAHNYQPKLIKNWNSKTITI